VTRAPPLPPATAHAVVCACAGELAQFCLMLALAARGAPARSAPGFAAILGALGAVLARFDPAADAAGFSLAERLARIRRGLAPHALGPCMPGREGGPDGVCDGALIDALNDACARLSAALAADDRAACPDADHPAGPPPARNDGPPPRIPAGRRRTPLASRPGFP